MAVLVQIISTIFPISKQKFFFEGGIRLRKFFLLKLILVYVLIYRLFSFHQISLWQLRATTNI